MQTQILRQTMISSSGCTIWGCHGLLRVFHSSTLVSIRTMIAMDCWSANSRSPLQSPPPLPEWARPSLICQRAQKRSVKPMQATILISSMSRWLVSHPVEVDRLSLRLHHGMEKIQKLCLRKLSRLQVFVCRPISALSMLNLIDSTSLGFVSSLQMIQATADVSCG